jgi:hypothetical protein
MGKMGAWRMTPFEKLLKLCGYFDLVVKTKEHENGYTVSITHCEGSWNNIKVAAGSSVDRAAQSLLDDMSKSVMSDVFGHATIVNGIVG